ncbi:MAG: esterase-like activity of phytase family protein [Pseudonocardiaceae bacterium]
MARHRIPLAIAAAVLAVGGLVGPAAADDDRSPTLVGRAILPTEAAPPGTNFSCPSSPPASATPVPEPQPAGGYSALIAGPGRSQWALPDNGYGAKSNSCDFILRVDQVRVDHLRSGTSARPGRVQVLGSFRLRDPDRKIPFPIFRQASSERLLTGWDFDPESVRIDRRGTFWFGDEFGPYLLHTDRTGKVLEAPIPTPGVRSPENQLSPPGQAVNLPGSSGFESMAISADGRFLYPALERALTTEPDKTRRLVFQFDLRRNAYTGKTFVYPANPAIPSTPPGQDQHVIADLTAIGDDRYAVIERDFRQGAAALFEKIFVVEIDDSDRSGRLLRKREIVDLLDIADPRRISLVGARPGDIGLGERFTFPYVTTESVLPVRDGVLAIVNDNNFGSIGGRNPTLPDYTDFIEVRVPGLGDDRPARDR